MSNHKEALSPPLEVDRLARSTKKVLDRLAPFCAIELPRDVESTCGARSISSSSSAHSAPSISRLTSPSMTPALSTSNSSSTSSTDALLLHNTARLAAQLSGSRSDLPKEANRTIDDVGVDVAHAQAQADPRSQTQNRARVRTERVVAKVRARVANLISAIDQHMLSAQIAFSMCKMGEAGDVDPSEDTLLALAKRGQDLVGKTEATFKEASQEVYKLAALTKDNVEIVLVPTSYGQTPSLRKTLKEVGLDLVANLNLISDFSRMVNQTARWWAWVVDDLELALSAKAIVALAESLDGSAAESNTGNQQQRTVLYPLDGSLWWSTSRQVWQSYYESIRSLQVEYAGLFPSSSESWRKSVAVAADSSDDPHLSSLNTTPSVISTPDDQAQEPVIVSASSTSVPAASAPEVPSPSEQVEELVGEYETEEGYIYVQGKLYKLLSLPGWQKRRLSGRHFGASVKAWKDSRAAGSAESMRGRSRSRSAAEKGSVDVDAGSPAPKERRRSGSVWVRGVFAKKRDGSVAPSEVASS